MILYLNGNIIQSLITYEIIKKNDTYDLKEKCSYKKIIVQLINFGNDICKMKLLLGNQDL